MNQPLESCPKWFRFLLLILLVVGIFFRLVNLDGKFYWFDEVYTSFRISGYTDTELYEQVYDGSVKTREQLQLYQGFNADKTWIDTVKGLAVEEPQLPPFYFVLARIWSQLFGNSVTVMRSLPALLSLLVFPSIYWLSIELFASGSVAWMAMGIVAISPFHILYAQEARPYSLWTVLILASSAALLQGMRIQTRKSWLIYACLSVFSVYTFLYSVLVIVAHGVYVVWIEKGRLTHSLKGYLLGGGTGFLSLIIWLSLVLYWQQSAIPETSSTLTNFISRVGLIARWIGNFSRILLDFNLNVNTPLKELLPILPLLLILLGISAYSVYFLWQNAPQDTRLFIVILIGVTTFPLMGIDFIKSWMRLSGVARYLIPWYLGVQLSLAYLFTLKLTQGPLKIWQQRFWQGIGIIVLFSGVMSSGMNAQAPTWWNKGLYQGDIIMPMAEILNTKTMPLLISDDQFAGVFPFIYLVNDQVRFQFVTRGNIPLIADNFHDVFLFRPSKDLREGIQERYQVNLKMVELPGKEDDGLFWQLEAYTNSQKSL